jgi:tRNA A37 methylthiotransferase MiaB
MYNARYSPRKQTYAAKISWRIPDHTRAERWDRLNALMYEIIQERNQLMIGREEIILVTKIMKKMVLFLVVQETSEKYLFLPPKKYISEISCLSKLLV